MIVSLLKIYFVSHIPFLFLGLSHGVDNFLEDNSIVSGSSSWKKAALEGTNKVAENRANPLNQDFGQNLVYGVTQTDWSKFFEGLTGINFGNQGYESVGKGWVKITRREGLHHQLPNIITNNVPILFEENSLEPIRARGLERLHGVQGSQDFLLTDWAREESFLSFSDSRKFTQRKGSNLHITSGTKKDF